MNGVSFRRESGLVDHLRHGRVGVNRRVYVFRSVFLIEGKSHLGD